MEGKQSRQSYFFFISLSNERAGPLDGGRETRDGMLHKCSLVPWPWAEEEEEEEGGGNRWRGAAYITYDCALPLSDIALLPRSI